MTTLTDNNKIEFYKFLIGDKSIEEFEDYVYSQKDLEKQIDNETYLNLIGMNFKDKYVKAKLPDLIKEKIIDEGQFETWKLKILLNNFINQSKKINLHLEKFYHLYCGVYQDNGQRKYQYKFLGNLGLNYLHWTDEGYLKTFYGDNWKTEYEKCSKKFEFYHEQLKGFAAEILLAIERKEIEILNDGTYRISTDLKNKLEIDIIYKLSHSNK